MPYYSLIIVKFSFKCETGDAMGMNMVGKGSEAAIAVNTLQTNNYNINDGNGIDLGTGKDLS